ncbi:MULTISPECIES: glycosyltransferase [Trichocoleus]|uniref:Glycosyltransferase n=1 Tax=Trichocoleus desertorum GB2-A4 TaxID=2933944 RepID=A0ABV0J283_9CYAN|nr:glycosyltransferase [Trichocoleus sp. FACHB-46]MBD1860382.1 glycosyltransferase [Trichocoleus sp. FACHB-46]
MQRRVIIYRDLLLPYSETFIPAQVESLTAYTGLYVGTSRTANATSLIPADRSLTLSDFVQSAGVWKMAFKLGGVVHPQWLQSLQALSPNLIHAHFGLDGIWGMRLARRLQLPLVVTFRGNDITGMDLKPGQRAPSVLDFWHRRGQFFRDYYVQRRPELFQTARYCIGVSDFIRHKVVEKGCPPEKAVVIYNGVNLDKFSFDPTLTREPVVLFVGRLVEKKGCEYLIRAMAAVQAARPDVELVLIGDGPQRAELESLARSVLKQYRFLGPQPHPTVKEWMNRANVLCAPSITAATGDSEGLPNVVTEALAMQLPVIGSIHAGIPEAVVHGETGFLTAERDWEAIAEHLLVIFNNPEMRNQMAIAGRQRIEQQFDQKHSIAKLEALYSEILAEPSVVTKHPL